MKTLRDLILQDVFRTTPQNAQEHGRPRHFSASGIRSSCGKIPQRQASRHVASPDLGVMTSRQAVRCSSLWLVAQGATAATSVKVGPLKDPYLIGTLGRVSPEPMYSTLGTYQVAKDSVMAT